MGCDAVFRAGSIAKAVTAMGVMRMRELGLVDLDEPVERCLRSWRFSAEACAGFHARGVTLRRVLSHSAGLNSGRAVFVPEESPVEGAAAVLRGEVEGHPKLMLEAEPGSVVRYTGMGYVLAQCLIEDVMGMPFIEAMSALVLGPLGMTSSGYGVDGRLRGRMATGHDAAGGALPMTTTANIAGSRLLSSAADVARV
jgi:CubicO group peptidase (beta-lactamase class C family)